MNMLRNSLVLLVIFMFVTACDNAPKEQDVKKEFVCYDDDVLAERHVDIESAIWLSNRSGWSLYYRDGQEAVYEQPKGETCQLESYTPKN